MKNILCFLLLTCCVNVFAQKQDLVSAIMDFKDSELETAKSAIDNGHTRYTPGGGTLEIKKAGVAITPGLDFDSKRGKQTIRFSYARTTDEIKEGIKRIIEFMDKYKE